MNIYEAHKIRCSFYLSYISVRVLIDNRSANMSEIIVHGVQAADDYRNIKILNAPLRKLI